MNDVQNSPSATPGQGSAAPSAPRTDARDIAVEFILHATRGDIAYCRNAIADDFVYELIANPNSIPGRTPIAGTNWLAFLTGIIDSFPAGLEMKIVGTTAENGRVAIEARSHGYTGKGSLYENVYHFLFEVVDGKVTKMREYTDTIHAEAVLHADMEH
jgi:ketosteroid isomerase-like protein